MNMEFWFCRYLTKTMLHLKSLIISRRVDRGDHSLKVILALLLLKLAYPNNVYLDHDNHEDSVVATLHGCSDAILERYGEDFDDLWKEFEDVFASLPLAVRTNSAVIIHGGLPSDDLTLEHIANIMPENRFNIKTMVEPSPDDTACQLFKNIMWIDPQP